MLFAAQAALAMRNARVYSELEKNRDAVDLFLTEADVTLLLEHPNVIRVHDSGEAGGRYYIAMEYVHGKDLGQICDRLVALERKMDVDIVVHIVIGRDDDPVVFDARSARGVKCGICRS